MNHTIYIRFDDIRFLFTNNYDKPSWEFLKLDTLNDLYALITWKDDFFDIIIVDGCEHWAQRWK